MSSWLWIIPSGLLLAGGILALAAATSNRWRWAVVAPLVFGCGTLALALIYRDWGLIAATAGLFFYAAINFRNLRRTAAGERT